MTLALWMVLAAGLVPYIGTTYAKFADGGGRTYNNNAPRAGIDDLPPARRRAYWAQLNGFEAFPLFAAAVIIAHISGASPYWTNVLAVSFVVLRLVYTLMYIYDKAAPRTLVWAAALACVFALFGLAAAA